MFSYWWSSVPNNFDRTFNGSMWGWGLEKNWNLSQKRCRVNSFQNTKESSIVFLQSYFDLHTFVIGKKGSSFSQFFSTVFKFTFSFHDTRFTTTGEFQIHNLGLWITLTQFSIPENPFWFSFPEVREVRANIPLIRVPMIWVCSNFPHGHGKNGTLLRRSSTVDIPCPGKSLKFRLSRN